MKGKARSLPPKLFGVTIDSVSYITSIIDAIKEIKRSAPNVKPVVRVVFDFDEDIFKEKKYRFTERDFEAEARRYKQAIETISKEAFVMGELIDSSAVYRCHYDSDDTRTYVERTKAYVRTLGDLVDIWEVGNEVNGEWVGWKEDAWEDPQVTVEMMEVVRSRVAREIKASFDVIKRMNAAATTALTFYYNDDGKNHGWTNDQKRNSSGQLVRYGVNYSLLKWATDYRALLPQVDYVLLSYYEDDNQLVRPNRNDMNVDGLVTCLKQLASLFKEGTRFGFGEFGPQCHVCLDRRCQTCLSDQAEFIKRYHIGLDKTITAKLKTAENGWDRNRAYIGGYFYWYFKQDVVNQKNTKTIEAFQRAFDEWYSQRTNDE